MEAEPAGRTEENGAHAANSAPAPSAQSTQKPVGHAESEPPTPLSSGAKVGVEPKQGPRPHLLPSRRVALLIILCAALVSSFVYLRHRAYILGRLKAGAEKAKEVLTGQPALTRDPYAEAVSKVEADRGAAEGRAAQVEVPAELKQYKEPRRFLAVQSASAAEAGVTPPHDFAELAEMIKGGRDLVEAPRLGRGYVLYGVGLTATGELTHYDAARKRSVPLFANADELNSFLDALATDRARAEAGLKEADDALKQVGRKDKAERARLLSEVAARRKELDDLKEKQELIAFYYGKAGAKQGAAARESDAGRGKPAGRGKAADKEKAAGKEKAGEKGRGGEKGVAAEKAAAGEKGGERLFAEYAALADLARDFGGRAYDLRDRTSAREFQARMLSFIRPAALSLMEELGMAYQAKFDRPLPVTSLVRTEEYQRLLRESGNPNAADVAPPPHTTGFAFDVYYRFMSAAEQEFVMGEIARLERDGRVEALRELRDHYHVFVFPDGHRPEEKTVEKVLRGRGKKG